MPYFSGRNYGHGQPTVELVVLTGILALKTPRCSRFFLRAMVVCGDPTL